MIRGGGGGGQQTLNLFHPSLPSLEGWGIFLFYEFHHVFFFPFRILFPEFFPVSPATFWGSGPLLRIKKHRADEGSVPEFEKGGKGWERGLGPGAREKWNHCVFIFGGREAWSVCPRAMVGKMQSFFCISWSWGVVDCGSIGLFTVLRLGLVWV